MSDDWRPSHHKPRGGLRALLPDWRVLRTILIRSAVIAVACIVVHGWDRDISFNLMKIGAAIAAVACVAPRMLTGRAPSRPGQSAGARGERRVALHQPHRKP